MRLLGSCTESKDLIERFGFKQITTSLGAYGALSPKLAAYQNIAVL